MSQGTNERIFEIMTPDNYIMEMAGDSQSINVPVDPRIDVGVLTSDDPSPMFVNVEVIRKGISKTNRRSYDNDVVREISTMIPGKQGYLGHPDPSKTSFEFREPQCIFVGATTQEVKEIGGFRTIAKAYIYKTSKLREWIPKSIAAKNPLTVSINALGDVVKDVANNLIHVKRFTQLDSIDWANPGTEGFGTSQALSVVSELQNDKGEGGPTMERNELVKGVTVHEMKAFNPDAVTGLIKGISLAELQGANPDLVKQIIESNKITEMQLTVDGKEQMVKFSDIQGVINAKDAKIAEMQKGIDEAKITEMRTRLLSEVPEQYREKVGKRVTGTNEAELKASITAEMDYIKEIGGSVTTLVKPSGNTARTQDDPMVGKMRSLFGVKEPQKK